MPLEGTARIVGSNDFSVFPEQIFLPPGGSGGVMVSFGPVLDGAREVILEVETNDPAVPLVRIPVRGVGLALDAAPDDGPPTDQDMANVNGEEVKAAGCGCQTGPAPSGGWLALLGLVFLRRGPTW